MQPAPDLFSHRKYWAARFGTAPFLPMSRAEMDALGWDSCDIILVTGDAYVDHPSFGMAIIGRLLEAQGFRVGIIAQPDWSSTDAFTELGAPNLFFGITAGNMDSMVNRYTSDRRIRRDDAYTPGGEGGKRPDRSVIVYAQRVREAFRDVPIVIGGIEASLRRIAHFDYWSEKVRRSVLLDAQRRPARVRQRRARDRRDRASARRARAGRDASPTCAARRSCAARRPRAGSRSTRPSIDAPGPLDAAGRSVRDRAGATARAQAPAPTAQALPARATSRALRAPGAERDARAAASSACRRSRQVRDDPVLYAHASRILHLESNPGNARALVQRHGDADVWLNPPPIPLTTTEMDAIYELPYRRVPHPALRQARRFPPTR